MVSKATPGYVASSIFLPESCPGVVVSCVLFLSSQDDCSRHFFEMGIWSAKEHFELGSLEESELDGDC